MVPKCDVKVLCTLTGIEKGGAYYLEYLQESLVSGLIWKNIPSCQISGIP